MCAVKQVLYGFTRAHAAWVVLAVISCTALPGCGQADHASGVLTKTPNKRIESHQAISQQPSKPWYRTGLRSQGFVSATGNIVCGLNSADRAELLCMAKDSGNTAVLGLITPVQTDWEVTLSDGPTLRYGGHWTSANFASWSERTGVKCRSLYSEYGLRINRRGVTPWVWRRAVLSLRRLYSGATTQGGGYATLCNDGTTSMSGGKQGACSWHGGVAGG
jgi:hypothetical protein